MSEIKTYLIYGYVVKDAADMQEAYDQIGDFAGQLEEGFDWQSDVMYGDEPSKIIVGVTASPTYDNFEDVNISILNERIEEAKKEFESQAPKLLEFLKSLGCEVSGPSIILFSYED